MMRKRLTTSKKTSMNYWVIPIMKYRNGVPRPRVSSEYDVEAIIGTVCNYYKLSDDVLCMKSRKRVNVQARQICMYLIRKYTLLTLKETADRLGGRDHTTTIHSVQTIQDFISTNDPITEDIKEIIELLKFNKN